MNNNPLNQSTIARPFDFLPPPAARSATKPRKRGLTMVIDQGLPTGYIADLAETAGDYIDLAKLKTGTARFYPEQVLRKKLDVYKALNILPFIGGQFHEYVLATPGAPATPRFYDEASESVLAPSKYLKTLSRSLMRTGAITFARRVTPVLWCSAKSAAMTVGPSRRI